MKTKFKKETKLETKLAIAANTARQLLDLLKPGDAVSLSADGMCVAVNKGKEVSAGEKEDSK